MPMSFRLSLPLRHPTKTCMHCSSPTHPSAKALPKSTNHEAPRYTVFHPPSTPLSSTPSTHSARNVTHQVPFLHKTSQLSVPATLTHKPHRTALNLRHVRMKNTAASRNSRTARRSIAARLRSCLVPPHNTALLQDTINLVAAHPTP